jgi:hypothetical protein
MSSRTRKGFETTSSWYRKIWYKVEAFIRTIATYHSSVKQCCDLFAARIGGNRDDRDMAVKEPFLFPLADTACALEAVHYADIVSTWPTL